MLKKKILIVDDEVELVKAIEIRFKASGYDVLIAHNGIEALDKARVEKPDLIILDLMLPKMDGFKVCGMLKTDVRYKHIPIIMCTARVQDSDRKIGLGLGADAYVDKPFQHELVLAKVKELLKEYELPS